jgi:hypothetical protein
MSAGSGLSLERIRGYKGKDYEKGQPAGVPRACEWLFVH